jgi:hypothetical protein
MTFAWLYEWWIYVCIVAGIFVSLLMPIVRQLATPPTVGKAIEPFLQRVWPIARPYVFMAIFSFLAALVIFAGVKVKQLSIDSKWGAFLLGYFCDSTIQKLKP